MRAAIRPWILLALCCSSAAIAKSPPTVPDPGVNHLAFVMGSPTPDVGGVSVSVIQKATAGYTCTKVTIRVIDNETGETLGTHIVDNPPQTITKSFAELGSNRAIQVTVDALFMNGDGLDPLRIEAVVTTR
jgi:hypothetical protein